MSDHSSRRRLDLAAQREAKLWVKMQAAYRAGRRGLLRHLINIYITSYDVRLAHTYRANQKRKKNRRLPLRALPAIAHEVDLLKPCREPVRTFRVPKDDGGSREIACRASGTWQGR